MENPVKEQTTRTDAGKHLKPDGKGQRKKTRNIHIKDVLLLLWSRKFLILPVFLIVVVGTAIYTAKQPKEYRAITRLVIEKETLELFPSSGSLLTVDTTTMDYFNTQCTILRTPALAIKVIETLRPKVTDPKTGEERAMYPSQLLGKITVRPVRDTRLVDVSVVDREPKQAAEIANAIANEFIKFDVTSRLNARAAAAGTIKQKLDELSRAVQDAVRDLNQFKEKNNIVSIEENHNLVKKNLTAATEAASKATQEKRNAEAVYSRIKDLSLQELLLEEVVAGDVTIQKLQADYRVAQAQLDALSTRYLEKHDRIKMQKVAVKNLESQVQAAAEEVRERLKGVWLAAKQKEADAYNAYKEAEQQVHGFDEIEAQYGKLQMEVETRSSTYRELLSRGTESDVERGAMRAPTEWEQGTSNIRVIDTAPIPNRPFRPKPLVNMAVAVFLGLALGCGAALFIEYLHDEVKNPDDVEEDLGMTLLATIPTPRKKLASSKEMGRIVYDHPTWHVTEAYRNLRTSIQLMGVDGRFPSLLVTSACPGEGKTTTAENLAIVIAQHGRKVLLVDTDMRRPKIRKDFDIDNSGGLVKYLVGESTIEDALLDRSEMAKAKKRREGSPEGEQGQLWILPCESRVSNSTEIIGSPKMEALVAELKKRFDVVIFDSPPCQFSDPLLLAKYVEGIVAVVEAHKYAKPMIVRGLERLEKVEKNKLFGVVLNKYNPKKAGGYGYYGYRSYYYYRYYDRYYYDYYHRPHRRFWYRSGDKRPTDKTARNKDKPEIPLPSGGPTPGQEG